MSRLFALCSFSLGLILLCFIIRLTAADSTLLPFWDQWAFTIEAARQNGHYTLAQLWQQHNEHRIVLTRLLLLADIHLFRATGHLLLAAILIGQFLHLLIFCRVIFWLDQLTAPLRVGLCGLACVFIFSPVQLDNFVWPWQVAFILGCLFTSLSFYFFVKGIEDFSPGSTRRIDIKLFCWSLAAALLSSLSSASGLFVWPVLVLLCLALWLNWRIIVAATGSAVLVIGSYLFHYHSPAAHANPLDSIKHPLQLLEYLVLYLGGAYAPYGHHTVVIVGSLGLVVSFILLTHGALRRRSLTRADLFCAAIVVLILGTGLATASGRISFGLDQALSSRYQTFAMTYWAALSIWATSAAAKTVRREWSAVAVGLASLVVGAVPLIKFDAITGPYAGRAGQWKVAEVSALSDVRDKWAMKAVSPDQYQTDPALDYLRLHRLSIFTDERYRRLGSDFSSIYHVNHAMFCQGEAKVNKYVHDFRLSGVQLSGWAWELASDSEITNFVLVDDRGKVTGFGTGGYGAPGQRQSYWFGYAREEPGVTKVQVYGVLDGKESCAIGSPQDVSSFFQKYRHHPHSTDLLSKGRMGVFRAGKWQFDPNDGIKPGAGPHRITFGQAGDIPVIGDWDGTGRLRIGVFRQGEWRLDMNGDDSWDDDVDARVSFGQTGDIPVVGDWDGTGKLRMGIFRNGQWWLDVNGDGTWTQDRDRIANFGQAGDIPVVGDWDGSGKLKIGIFRNGQWLLDLDGDETWTAGKDRSVVFGRRGDAPVIGDWDHTGKLRIGVFRDGRWLVDLNGNYAWDGAGVDKELEFGQSGDLTSILPWPVPSKPE